MSEDLQNSIPMAESMVEAENASHDHENKICLNCGTELKGLFCHQCGQKNIPRRQALGELIENFLGSFFSFESKFFRTTRYLLLRPGFLVNEYNAGRRDRYYHPARMYVFISFVYFLIYFSIPDEGKDIVQTDNKELAYQSSRNGTNFNLGSREYKTRAQYDSVQATLPVEKRDGWFMHKLKYRQIDLNKKYEGNSQGFVHDFGEMFSGNLPKVFFFLLPIFAMLLKLLYVRRDFFYSEHLVASIYMYNFFFLVGSLTMLIELIPGFDEFSVVTFLGGLAYLLVAMKKIYKQGWRKTIVKFSLLLVGFSLCLSLGMGINLIITLLFI